MTYPFAESGNILGSQQHGFIDSVGFDLYTQMLNEAVRRKQGKQTTAPKTVVEIQLGVDAYIPNAYIPDERQKLKFINAFVSWKTKRCTRN